MLTRGEFFGLLVLLANSNNSNVTRINYNQVLVFNSSNTFRSVVRGGFFVFVSSLVVFHVKLLMGSVLDGYFHRRVKFLGLMLSSTLVVFPYFMVFKKRLKKAAGF